MSALKIARLADRGVVDVTGPDSEKLLQGLVTNDLDGLELGGARHAALLSPQGKILFDFFVVRIEGGFLLDVARAKAPDLVKRLSMYKLRADVVIADVSPAFDVFALWGDDNEILAAALQGLRFADPRHAKLGLRLLAEGQEADPPTPTTAGDDNLHQDYAALRVALGVPEGGKDYDFGDAYPHEADLDLFKGVSFTKGCYVGQEVVARMHNKTIVRKRVVKISGDAPLTSGTDILLGEIPIGRIGTVDGRDALAMLRLDRALEAADKNIGLTAGGVAVTPEAEALSRYRASVAARPASAAIT